MTNNVIYALIDPRTDEIRYIGFTVNLRVRVKNHLTDHHLKQKSHKNNWLKQLKQLKLRPKVWVICDYETAEELPRAEMMWIANYRILGCNLTNGDDGGYGGKGMPKTPEHRAKIAAALKGRKQSKTHIKNSTKARKGLPAWNKGIPRTPEERKKVSEGRKRYLERKSKDKIPTFYTKVRDNATKQNTTSSSKDSNRQTANQRTSTNSCLGM